ncbi:SAM-dependent methyltransferase [Bacteroidetes/Chlorobi group bacterium Naka2016]|jgi:type I restriction enzyme M protein|nr:MAG: SAM-dependent methyltransferase [Bacteroidetes/Chlorobi group bacterium Naka2016]
MEKIQKIFSTLDVKHGKYLFTNEEIRAVEEMIIEQDGKFYIKCQIKDKYKLAKPEEIVRQLWIYRLLNEYNYPKERIDIERVVHFGSRDSGLADVVVLHEDKEHPYIIFEVKRPQRTAGLEQLKSYCNAEGAPIGVWSNGNEMIRLHREEPNIFVEIPRIPKAGETLRDILTERWTLRWLEEHDELKQGKTTLKKILLDLEELVLGNAGVDPFEEIFKLIYAKLYDEWNGINDPSYQLQFFVGDRSPEQVKIAISNLLEGAKREWQGVFEPTDKIELRNDHLKVCVSFLEKIKLFNSNLRIIDEAFEYLIPQVSKKKEGQFFTPRPVEDMVVKMLNPKANEFVIDPACGSAGFLLHSVMWVAGGMISGKPLPENARNFAQTKIYGIDFAKKAVKIAKAINLIVGDGKSHVYKDNSLAPHTWEDETKSGLRGRLLRFPDHQKDRENQEKFLFFDFDVLMTNPPFAGTVKERDILRLYKLSERNGKLVNKIGRHILFLERALQFIRPGGRMAIVLPQGLLNNTNAEYIRRFIIDEARILAVVGLHVNTFKPHTGTKTSVLFLRKYTDEEKEKILQIRLKYESEWEEFLRNLKEKYQNLSWDSQINEEEIPEELNSFLETYFESREEIEELPTEESEVEETEEAKEENKGKKPLAVLIQEKSELDEALQEKQEELENANTTRKSELKKEIKTLQNKINKLTKEISERTLSGQISLVLTEEKITEAFKKYWLDGKVMKEIDYPIFFAVNEKPVKDESGEYRNKKAPNGDLVMDEHGHPVIDHDLDEITDAFIEFAKEYLKKGDKAFDFWR